MYLFDYLKTNQFISFITYLEYSMTMDHAVEVPIGQHWVGMKRESRQLVRWDKWIDTRNGETQMEAPSEVRELLNQDMERASRSVKDILGTVASGLFIITTYASYIILVCGEYYSNGLFNPWGTKSIVLGGIATLLYSLVLWGFIKLLTTPPGFVPRRFQGTNPLCSDDEMLDLPQCIPCNVCFFFFASKTYDTSSSHTNHNRLSNH